MDGMSNPLGLFSAFNECSDLSKEAYSSPFPFEVTLKDAFYECGLLNACSACIDRNGQR